MAIIGDSCLKIGDEKWFIGSNDSVQPEFEFPSELLQGMLNGYVSITPNVYSDEYDTLQYEWQVELKPHDSMVDINGIIYKDNGQTALLFLDKIGLYKLKLIVNGANGGCSKPSYIHVLATPFDYNYINQTALDVSWIWKTLPDFWQLASNRDKSRIEVFWRGINQMLGSDLLNTYNTKESASIATIRDSVIRRWVKIDTSLPISDAIIKIQLRETLSTGISNVNRGFVNGIEQVNLPFNYTYRLSCKAISPDRVELFDRFLSTADVGKFVTLYRIVNNTATWLAKTNILNVTNQENRCILTLSNIFDREILNVQEELYLYIGVDTSNFPCVINQAYSCLLFDNGTSISEKRVPKFDNVDTVVLDFYSFIICNNAEALGVTQGDLLNITIKDNATGIQFTTNLDVVGCIDKFIMFDVPNIIELLQKVYEVLEPLEDSNYLAQLVYNYISSRNFTEIITSSFSTSYLDCYLPVTSELIKSYRISFNKIYRRKRTVIDNEIISLTRLTERIERVEFQNNTLIPNDDDLLDTTRAPLDFFENLDFFVDSNTIVGRMMRSIDLNTFTTNNFDFNFSGVENGDTLFITDGFGRGSYDIVKISADGSTIYVDPPTRLPFIGASFKVEKNRNNGNRHLTFYNKLPKENPVEYLWCEAAVFNNDRSIDLNFGGLCSFRLDKWYDLGIGTSYKDIVIAILLSRMTAPSLKNIATLTSNIAGLPFLDTTSKIIDINEKFEVSPIDGQTPTVSSMIVEEIDSLGIPTGIYRNIKFKPNTLFTDEAFTGLAINPATGSRYKIGDTVQQFATLALGVVVEDLYNEQGRKFLKDVKDRHRFKVTISADSISLTDNSIRLIKSFLLDLKPAYTQFILGVSKFIFDTINIEEDVFFKINTRFFDNPLIAQQIPQIQDEWTPHRQGLDRFGFIPLNVDFPRDGSVVVNNGVYLILDIAKSNYIRDLRLRTLRYDLPDYVILTSNGQTVVSLIEDILYDVAGGKVRIQIDGNPSELYRYTLTPNKVKYTFIRYISDKIDSQKLQYGNNPNFVTMDNINVAVGDYVYLNVPNAHRYTVQQLVNNGVRIDPQLPNSVIDNIIQTIVRRDTVFKETIFTGFVEPQSIYSFRVFDVANLVYEGIEPGDEVTVYIKTMIKKVFVTAVTRTNILYVEGDMADLIDDVLPIGRIEVKRKKGTDLGDKQDETVTSAISDCLIRMSKPAFERISGTLMGNVVDVLIEDITTFDIKPGDLLQIKETQVVLTEGKGVARVVFVYLPIEGSTRSGVILSENIAGSVENPINISFNVIKQANRKLTRL